MFVRLTRRQDRRAGWSRSPRGTRVAYETGPRDIEAVSEDPWYKKPSGIIGLGVVIQLVSAIIKWLLGVK